MRITNENYHQQQSGFTIVEVITTVVLSTIFLVIFMQSYLVLESQRITVARQARASDVAYTNLHKVPSRPAQLTLQLCTDNANVMDLTTGTPSTKPGLDITQFGYQLESDTNLRKVLGATATQSLVIYAPSGCAALTSSPIEVVSTVTYGINGDKVTHARYIK